MVTRSRIAAALLASSLFVPGALASGSKVNDLLRENPGVQVFEWQGQLSRIYGAPMSYGADPEASAWSFLEKYASVFGAEYSDLRLMETADALAYQPVMYDPDTNEFKFYALYFGQVRNDNVVWGSNLTLVVRNDASQNYPLVLAVNDLKDLSGYSQPAQGVMNPAQIKAQPLAAGSINDPQPIIYFAEDIGEDGEARLAYTYEVEFGDVSMGISQGINGEERDGRYDKRRIIVDAVTGQPLLDESLVHTVDVVGNVKGKATPGLVPDRANNQPVDTNLPNVTVEILGGNDAETDEDGNFTIQHGGNQQVTVRSEMYGPSLTQGVVNEAGSELLLDLAITPPGPANFLHNVSPTEFNTSQVNAMYQTSLIHSRVLEINPAYPQVNRSFVANVNINSSCNAFYNGSSINFYRRQGGCENTAFSTVVHHEYGHKLVGDAGTNQGAYGEGQSDVMAIVMTESPIVGEDFFTNGGDIRDARVGRQYPCNGPIHSCGQILSGCAYFTQEALRVTEPDDYRDILGALALNSILFRPPGIDPGITIDWLTLDDDDNNLSNGTPHYFEIDDGFSRHNMAAPPLSILAFDYPNGLPEVIDPDGGTSFRVEVSSVIADPQPGTGMLHYNDGNGYVSVAMNEISNNIYDAVFPATVCGSSVSFYVSAETTDNQTINDPANAPVSSYSTISAYGLNIIFEDDFETDKGWTVENQNVETGAWVRAIPSQGGTRGDPENDFDGSGRCFVTGNGNDEDLDGGPTRLISPTFDMSAGDGTVSYARWHTNDDNDDFLVVEISNNNGGTWVNVETVGSSNGWTEHSFLVSDVIAPTGQMKLRFTSSDQPNNSVTESAIDAVRVQSTDCGGGDPYMLTISGSCPGQLTIGWSNAAPNASQGIVFGNNLGSTTIPNGNPCAGTILGVSGGVQLVTPPGFFSTGNGSGSISGQAGGGACGHYLQLVQGGNCQTSNVEQIPN